ncbi:2-hydroxyacyl-CoA dehydratase subunit D [Chloroflexota bacterium]
MTEKPVSEMARAVRSTETAKSVNKLVKAWYARARESSGSGRRVVWAKVGLQPELLTIFDIDAVWPENFGAACAAKQVAVDFIETAEADGYGRDTCSYARNTLGYSQRWIDLGVLPPEAPAGGMAKPDMLVTLAAGCDVGTKWWQALATRYWGDVPIHEVDVQSPPYGLDLNDERIKEHYVAHMEEEFTDLVAFLEKHTGKKYDEAKLSEAIVKSYKAQRLSYEVEELRKAVPSPMPGEDYFACIVPQLYMVGEQEAVDFYQSLYDEVKYRVDNKIGVIPDEKYRILWVGIPPWFNLGIFNYLESLGSVSVIETQYYIDKPPEVDPSNPLRALAERAWLRAIRNHELGGEMVPDGAHTCAMLGFAPVGLVTQFVRDYKIDGIIMHSTVSCRAVPFGQAHTRNVLPKYLDTPVTFFESDMADPRSWADAQIKKQINVFMEVLTSAKRKAKVGK